MICLTILFLLHVFTILKRVSFNSIFPITQSELSDQFANLPTSEEFSTFVTWPDLEAALKGLRTEFEPVEPDTQTVESQTEAVSNVDQYKYIDN